MKKLTVSEMTITALMTALLCVISPLSLPIGPVPISLCILGILVSVYLLGMKLGTLSVVLYLLIGFAGVPVFAGYTAGAAKLLGPTGGYMIGYVCIALIAGFFMEKWSGKIHMQVVGMVVGILVCYILGTAWLAYEASMTFTAALWAGVIPFIPGDICKIIVTLLVAGPIKKALVRANLIGKPSVEM